ncbi:hypothetical protein PAXINDRAFT_180357 [Paxillus involutus ATCC 200175]|nr:hypothetical protein PAXINDRAFT_180357 [Paxillus involutus ATCC 200175]
MPIELPVLSVPIPLPVLPPRRRCRRRWAVDLSHALSYFVMLLNAASAPAGINQRLDRIEGMLEGLQGQIGGLQSRTGELTDLAYRLHNGGCGEGRGTHYKIIPFRLRDGREVLPTRYLPPLIRASDVRELSAQHLTWYLNGYNVRNAGLDEAEKRRLLFHRIGCTFIRE